MAIKQVPQAPPEVELLSPFVNARRRAAKKATDPLSLAWAALTDDDAHVRAHATARVKAEDVVAEAARDLFPIVRAAAYRSMGRNRVCFSVVDAACFCEPIWWARRRAVMAVACFLPSTSAIASLARALSDPFWRVRFAAVKAILKHDVVDDVLALPATSESHAAALAYLRRRREGAKEELAPDPQPFRIDGPLFDADPAVMSKRLEDPAFVVDNHTLVLLLGDPHEPLRERALRRLLASPSSKTSALRTALTWLEDPRVPHATETALRFLDEAGDAAREVAEAVVDDVAANVRVRRWAISYAHRTNDVALLARVEREPAHAPLQLPLDDVRQRRAEEEAGDEFSCDSFLRVRAVTRCEDPRVALRGVHDPSVAVRAHARARLNDVDVAAFLDDEDAGVAAGARALLGIVDEELSIDAPPRAPRAKPVVTRRALGLPLLVVSGANDVATSALQRAEEAGANAFFWEPRYLAMTRFLRHRRDVVVVCGSYEASRRGIEHDIARAQKLLGRRTLDVFLLFWARSVERLNSDAFAILDDAKRRGDVGAIGFSTHLRELAMSAVHANPWDVVMTRHSAAHPGAEDALFPLCAEKNVAVLSFSATSYGRLITDGVTALDCYAYSLAQPGVSAVISAPRTAAELDENLAVVDEEARAAVSFDRLREVAVRVRRDSKDVAALVRRAPMPPAAAAAASPSTTKELP